MDNVLFDLPPSEIRKIFPKLVKLVSRPAGRGFLIALKLKRNSPLPFDRMARSCHHPLDSIWRRESSCRRPRRPSCATQLELTLCGSSWNNISLSSTRRADNRCWTRTTSRPCSRSLSATTSTARRESKWKRKGREVLQRILILCFLQQTVKLFQPGKEPSQDT